MNENPGETPNPLNPNPEENPGASDIALDANPSEPIESVNTVQPEQVDPLMQATDGITDQPSSDPMSRPMEKAPVAEPVTPPKKKKTGLIIGIVAAVLVAVGCGVVAAIMLMGQGDPVSKAVLKLAEGKAPTNVAINGTIDVTPTDKDSVLTNLKIDLKSDATTNSMINHTTANITASLDQMGKIEIEAEEIYAESGDLYIKIDGLTEAINNLSTMVQGASLRNSMVTDCVSDEGTSTDCLSEDMTIDMAPDENGLAIFDSFSGILEIVDGEWLRISIDQLESVAGSMDSNNSLSCLTDVMQEAKSSSNSIAELYRKYPFVGSTTEGVTIASKNSPVYRVMFDREKFTSYSDALNDSTIAKKAISCLGDDNVTINKNAVEELDKLPNVYVEVDKDNNFSRVYFETTLNQMKSDDCHCPDDTDCSPCFGEAVETNIANVKFDFELTYPSAINVAEPTEYQDLVTVIQQLMMSSNEVTEEAIVSE